MGCALAHIALAFDQSKSHTPHFAANSASTKPLVEQGINAVDIFIAHVGAQRGTMPGPPLCAAAGVTSAAAAATATILSDGILWRTGVCVCGPKAMHA